MKLLLIISLSFALFGSWQLCLFFGQYIERSHQVHPIKHANAAWLVVTQLFAILSIVLFLWDASGGLVLMIGLLAASTMGFYGIHIGRKTDFATSVQAILVYSTFICLFAIVTAVLSTFRSLIL